MADDGRFETRPFPRHRIPTVDTLELGRAKHHVPVLLEVDVTDARARLRARRARTGERLSFTGWVATRLGRAVREHPGVQAMRQGSRRLVVFDDVDVAVVVERVVAGGRGARETLPMPYVIRRADAKSVAEATEEIRDALSRAATAGDVDLGSGRPTRLTRLFTVMPRFLRQLLVWRRLTRDPFFARRSMGTVALTNVGSVVATRSPVWAIPLGIHPLLVALGGVTRKPTVVRDAIVVREILSLTVVFDHDVVDGAPVARFLDTLTRMLVRGDGLEDEAG